MRDPSAGLRASRARLLAQRRAELALLPLSLGRIFTHRVARAGASLGALATFAIALHIEGRSAHTFSVVMSAVAIATPIIYLLAAWVAEAHFDRRMARVLVVDASRAETGDSLGRGPADTLVGMIERFDGIIALLPIFAVAVISCSTAIATTHSHAIHSDDAALLVVIAATLLALAIGRACDRETWARRSRFLTVMGHWAFAINVALLATAALRALAAGACAAVSLGLPALVMGSVVVALGIRRRECNTLATWFREFGSPSARRAVFCDHFGG